MQAGLQATLSCTLTFGVPLCLALLELRNLRRRGGWDRDPIPDEDTPRPLPPCLLIPPLDPAPMFRPEPKVQKLETTDAF